VFGVARDEVRWNCTTLHNENFTKCYSGDHIKKNEMDGVFSTCGSDAHRVVVGVPEGKRPLERTRLRWEGNMNMDLKGIVGVDWIDLAQDRAKWRLL
jgi:hypothetical protein